MLLIGRGIILGLTGGQVHRLCGEGARLSRRSSTSARPTPSASTTRSRSPWSIVVIGAVVLAKTRWGYETFATGGNEQAAVYAGIPTRWVRIRAYLLSSLCATLAGLMAITQDKGVTAQAGLSSELIVIAAVIIGGASILGGRGRVIGACLGAMLTVRHRQGAARRLADHPHHRRSTARTSTVNAIAQLPVGAVPALLGALAAAGGAGRALYPAPATDRAVLRRGCARRQPPLIIEAAGIAIEGVQTKGTMASDKALTARGFGKFLARRDALAIILTVVLWLIGAVAAARLLVEPAEQLRHPAQLHRAGAARDRPHLRDRRRRHRSVGRRGAGAGRCRDRLRHEGAWASIRWIAVLIGLARRQRGGPASTPSSPSASACRPSSPPSACSISRAASPPGSSPASS